MTPEASAMLAAYREAWDERDRTGRTDHALLLERLAQEPAAGPWAENPRMRTLLVRRWDGGVRPEQLRRSLVRELPSVLTEATMSTVRALKSIRSTFTDD